MNFAVAYRSIGNSRMKLYFYENADWRMGTALIGDIENGNYSQFESDGTLLFNGNATVWKDINMGAAQIIVPSAGNPGIDELKDSAGDDTGVETLAFALNEHVSGIFEMQHDYKQGSDFIPHIHWQGITAPGGGTDNVKWQMDYTVARNGSTIAPVTTIYIQSAFTTQYAMIRSDFTTIDGSTAGIGSSNVLIGDQFCFKLTRIAASADDYAGDALMVTAGIHYEIDTVGSRTIEK